MEKFIIEGFVSLRDMLRNAVKQAYGDKVWVADFSTGEVVFETPTDEGSQFMLVAYTIKDGVVEFTGAPRTVQQRTTYEDRVRKASAEALKGPEQKQG